MTSISASPASQATWHARLLRFPLIRIVIALLAIAIPFAAVAMPLNLFVSDKWLKKAGALLLTVVVVGAYSAFVRWIERRAVTEFSTGHALRELGVGILLGALLLSLTIGVLAALGAYRVTGSNGWLVMLATIPGFILGAVLEEVVMRGIVFRILEQSLGSWIALALSAALFGLLHLLNPGTTLLNAAAIMLEAGIMLAAAYMLTRRLWLCIGIHFAWNFSQGGIFSAAVSGGTATGLLQAHVAGPVWLTGGAFGAEASVVAVVICTTAGLLFVIAAKRKRRFIEPFWAAGAVALPVT
ncbi:MAG: type II CAAX endopeptidase family protein [Steroidobacteraceae bacterium]|jgi:membrane protease YdiL (CAAX protease family)